MTALPEHPASSRLALLTLCGDLVVALDAMSIREIRRVAETTARAMDRMWVLEIEGERVPGWDLGELLAIETAPSAWVIVDLPGLARPVGFRLGRCVVVHALPVCRALPPGIYARRPGAFAAAFSTAGIAELTDHVSGVVVDLSCALGEDELASIAKLGSKEREAAAG